MLLHRWLAFFTCVSPRNIKKGGLSTLSMGTYIASSYYYPVLCEHGKKGGAAPLPPLGETLPTFNFVNESEILIQCRA